MEKKEILIIFIGISLITLISSLFFYFKIEPIYSLSLRLSDINFSLNKQKISDPIILVLVDEKSINKLGRWPWDRKVLADGLRKLKKAKVVVLDMVFSEKTNINSDKYLADTIGNLGNVICGMFVRKKATENPSEDVIDILSDSALFRLGEIVPFPEVKYIEVNILPITESCLLSGIFNAVYDKDGLFRRYPLGFIFEGNLYPSLGIQALRVFLNSDIEVKDNYMLIKNIKIPIEESSAVLNYYKYKEYRRNSISFIDLYEGKFTEDYFKGKIVIVGISEAGITDIRATPIGQVPGSYLHVTFISNALQNILLKYGKLFTFVLIILSSIVVLLTAIYFKTSLKIASYILLFSFILLFSKILYIYKNTVLLDLYPLLNSFFSILYVEIYESLLKTKQTMFLKRLFSTYVSKEVLKEILENPDKLKLGGEKREITVLFSDIRGFTHISEKLDPEELVKLLNIYMSKMSDIVLKNKGMLDKYIGDAIMAIWNAPIEVKEHRKLAILTAYEMLKQLKNVNKILKKENLPTINIGIGINTGYAVVGNMGSEQKFEYTAIGDTVNLASRLEGLNKIYFLGNSGVLLSEFTVLPVKKEHFPFYFVEIDMVVVKGKEKPVRIFSIIEDQDVKTLYEKALFFYRKGNFEKAMKIFESINFIPAKVMAERCKELIKNPPENWNGVYVAKTK